VHSPSGRWSFNIARWRWMLSDGNFAKRPASIMQLSLEAQALHHLPVESPAHGAAGRLRSSYSRMAVPSWVLPCGGAMLPCWPQGLKQRVELSAVLTFSLHKEKRTSRYATAPSSSGPLAALKCASFCTVSSKTSSSSDRHCSCSSEQADDELHHRTVHLCEQAVTMPLHRALSCSADNVPGRDRRRAGGRLASAATPFDYSRGLCR